MLPRRASLACFAFASLASLAFGAAGCGGTTEVPTGKVVQSQLPRDTAPAVTQAERDALSSGNAAFAHDLYGVIAKANDGKNVFFSPISVSLALAMTYAGARGTTADEMKSALHFDLPADRLHPAFDALDLELASRGDGKQAKDGSPFRVRIANSLWGQDGTKFQDPFLDVLSVSYGAGMHVVDFIGASETARASINGWVAQATENRIQELMPEGSVNDSTRLVLVNAVYFNGAWATPFDPNATQPAPFSLLSGATTSAPTMMVNASFGYTKTASYEAVEVPYADTRLALLVVAPDVGSFGAVEGGLDGAAVTSIEKSLASQPIELHLPKVKFEGATVSLAAALRALGMRTAFTDAADFSGMASGAALSIGDVLHKAWLDLDEQGTEAAAATGVTVGTTSVMQPGLRVAIDRPYLIFLRDVPTATTIFAGRIVDPTQ